MLHKELKMRMEQIPGPVGPPSHCDRSDDHPSLEILSIQVLCPSMPDLLVTAVKPAYWATSKPLQRCTLVHRDPYSGSLSSLYQQYDPLHIYSKEPEFWLLRVSPFRRLEVSLNILGIEIEAADGISHLHLILKALRPWRKSNGAGTRSSRSW